jgi:hypothetical protein
MKTVICKTAKKGRCPYPDSDCPHMKPHARHEDFCSKGNDICWRGQFPIAAKCVKVKKEKV